MASSIITDSGRDRIVQTLAGLVSGQITKFKLGEGGYVRSIEISEVFVASASGTENSYTFAIAGGSFVITGVDLPTKTFFVDDDQTTYFNVGAKIVVEESSGNDGVYTVSSISYSAPYTEIVVLETIPYDSISGVLRVDRLPICKGPSDDAYHYPMRIIEMNGATPIQILTDTTGEGDLTGDGTGTVNYKAGAIAVTFTSNVAAGNTVVGYWKYANEPIDPVPTKTQLDAEGDDTLFFFEKVLTSDKFEFQGSGSAKVKVTVNLDLAESISDGTTWGGTPYFFEGGLYDEDDTLLCYFTFDKERKSGSSTLEHVISILF